MVVGGFQVLVGCWTEETSFALIAGRRPPSFLCCVSFYIGHVHSMSGEVLEQAKKADRETSIT